MLLQSVVRTIYPPQCIACGDLTEAEFGLCASCWRDTTFADGVVCDTCGAPLPGSEDDSAVYCDDCMTTTRPWVKGRAALIYSGTGRKIVLALKHGDRTDIARIAGPMLLRAGQPLFDPSTVLVPVPLHWQRMISRRYNQAALMALALAKLAGIDVIPDALVRVRRTKPLEGHDRNARFAALDGAIRPHPRRGALLAGRSVVIVDDVMTSGATLAAATLAATKGGASRVCVLALARVTKDT